MNSFSVRCFFLWEQRPGQKALHLYEERITMWKAEDFDDVIQLAEEEARTYAEENGVEYLDYAQAFELSGTVEVHGAEVFSLLRESDLEPDDYLDAFFDTGSERQGGEEPSSEPPSPDPRPSN
jgi:hypothetical protein